MTVEWQYAFAAISAVTSIFFVIGLSFAYMQASAANKALKAQVLMKLIDEWKDPKLYRAMIYVSRLRTSWKEQPTTDWLSLAKDWVATHGSKDANSADAAERALWEEWEMRRIVSQFLSKTGALINSGYLSEDEFFSVNPEVGRQLVVLMYIEKAIIDHYSDTNPIADWDHPFPKHEFNMLWTRYQKWHKKHGATKSVLILPDLPARAPNLEVHPLKAATPKSSNPAKQ